MDAQHNMILVEAILTWGKSNSKTSSRIWDYYLRLCYVTDYGVLVKNFLQHNASYESEKDVFLITAVRQSATTI